MTYEIQLESAPLNLILSFYLFILSFLILFTIQLKEDKTVQNLLPQPDLAPKISNLNWNFFYLKEKEVDPWLDYFLQVNVT